MKKLAALKTLLVTGLFSAALASPIHASVLCYLAQYDQDMSGGKLIGHPRLWRDGSGEINGQILEMFDGLAECQKNCRGVSNVQFWYTNQGGNWVPTRRPSKYQLNNLIESKTWNKKICAM